MTFTHCKLVVPQLNELVNIIHRKFYKLKSFSTCKGPGSKCTGPSNSAGDSEPCLVPIRVAQRLQYAAAAGVNCDA